VPKINKISNNKQKIKKKLNNTQKRTLRNIQEIKEINKIHTINKKFK
jgi:hypothetical protein